MDIKDFKKIYMIGIGGIGMSALARYFLSEGRIVAGYDRVSTSLTDDLSDEGASIHYSEQPELMKREFGNPSETLVVYTPAVPPDHKELAYFRQYGFNVLKRSEVLGRIAENNKCIAVAGTHGKTTISTLTAHLLYSSGISCSAFLGGISKNYKTNAIISKNSKWIIAEADEFDRSFLRLFPDKAIVTSCDADHLDIYGNVTAVEEAFRQFILQVKSGGDIVIRKDIEFLASGKENARVFTYSIYQKADFSAGDIKLTGGEYYFTFHTPGESISGMKTGMPGLVNVENAVAVAAMGYIMGIGEQAIRDALETYMGVKRRFDFHIRRDDVVYIDDYAHHPKELESFIRSVRNLYPERKITGIFQPHLYTRTRDFAGGFARSLSELDELILLDIYPARELPLQGISSRIIFDNVTIENKMLCRKEDLLDELRIRKVDVLLTMGAGDIDQFVEPIKTMLG